MAGIVEGLYRSLVKAASGGAETRHWPPATPELAEITVRQPLHAAEPRQEVMPEGHHATVLSLVRIYYI